jgi:hypothetical protein
MFTSDGVFNRKTIHGFARVGGTIPLYIPAKTAVVIPCTGLHCTGDIMVSPLTNRAHLHRHFQLVNTCAVVTKGHLWVRVANIDDEDIYIKPRTRVGTVSTCKDQNSNSSISFNRIRSIEEIFIKGKSDVCEQSCLNP